MSEAALCPVCESPNPPDAVSCQVCGERLAAPAVAPSEDLAAQQQVDALVEELPAEAQGEESDDEAALGQFALDDDDDDDDLLVREHDLPEEPVRPGAPQREREPLLPEELAEPLEEAPLSAVETVDHLDSDRPSALYSHVTGHAFPEGSIEYEEGFGPMGEKLYPTPPELLVQEDEDAPDPGQLALKDAPTSSSTTGGAPATQPLGAEAALAASAAPKSEPAFRPSPPNPAAAPPPPGPYNEPAKLVLYAQRQPVLEHDIDSDEVLIGRRDIRADIHPDIDLTPWDDQSNTSRKHAYIYRQNKHYTLVSVSNAGLQLNSELLDLGDKRQLSDGDVIVFAGVLAMKFTLPTS